MNRQYINNQLGTSPLVLLFLVVLGIFLMWELNESITYFPRMDAEKAANQPTPEPEPICVTGISDDCNDSNDVFLLPATTP